MVNETNEAPSTNDEPFSTTSIILIVVGVVIALIVIAIIVFILLRSNKKKAKDAEELQDAYYSSYYATQTTDDTTPQEGDIVLKIERDRRRYIVGYGKEKQVKEPVPRSRGERTPVSKT
jgi:flagellar basal body-associated protein FliL